MCTECDTVIEVSRIKEGQASLLYTYCWQVGTLTPPIKEDNWIDQFQRGTPVLYFIIIAKILHSFLQVFYLRCMIKNLRKKL